MSEIPSGEVERLRTLRRRGYGPDVGSETLEDTIRDLGAYCLLWLARPQEQEA